VEVGLVHVARFPDRARIAAVGSLPRCFASSGRQPLAQSHDVKSTSLGVHSKSDSNPVLLAQNQTGAHSHPDGRAAGVVVIESAGLLHARLKAALASADRDLEFVSGP
jgi:hypothetical protein